MSKLITQEEASKITKRINCFFNEIFKSNKRTFNNKQHVEVALLFNNENADIAFNIFEISILAEINKQLELDYVFTGKATQAPEKAFYMCWRIEPELSYMTNREDNEEDCYGLYCRFQCGYLPLQTGDEE